MKFNQYSEERWATIPDFPKYLISDHGRVFSTKNDRILKPILMNHGYLTVTLFNQPTSKKKLVHRLVALAFIGDIPDGFEVNHINAIKTENHFTNLEIVTHGDNVRHAYSLGLVPQTYSRKAILCVELNLHFRSLKDAAEYFGIGSSGISQVLSGRQKTAAGHTFRFVETP